MILQHAHAGPFLQCDGGIVLGSTDALLFQVLNASQALKLAQPTSSYREAVMALCAQAAAKGPGRHSPQSPARVAAYKAFTMTNIACPLVLPITIAVPFVPSCVCVVIRAIMPAMTTNV